MIIREIRNTIFEGGAGETEYYVIDNGYKNWYIPRDNVKKGLDILQAIPWKTRFAKKVFCKFHRVFLIRKLFGTKIEKLSVSKNILEIISKYCQKDYSVAVYGGNWGSKQNHKITLQIYDERQVFFYVKVAKDPIILELFEREKNTIERLEGNGIVEYAKYVDTVQKNEWQLFIQEPVNGYEQVIDFTQVHMDKLIKLNEKFGLDCSFEETDLCKLVTEEKSRGLEQKDYALIDKAYEKVKQWMESESVKCSLAHGDFTPWNVYVNGDSLYMFDLEYSQDKATPFFDFYHYIFQTAIVSKKNTISYIEKMYEKYREQINEKTDAKMAFMAYLVYIIYFYFNRYDTVYTTNRNQYATRIEMLRKLLEETE